MTLNDLEWQFHTSPAISVVAEFLVLKTQLNSILNCKSASATPGATLSLSNMSVTGNSNLGPEALTFGKNFLDAWASPTTPVIASRF